MTCICEARHNSESFKQHSQACEEQNRRKEMTQNAGKATREYTYETCHVCEKPCILRERDGVLFFPLHAHWTEGGMCKGSGTSTIVIRHLTQEQIDKSTVVQDPPPFLSTEVEAELKPVPPDVVRSAERLDQNFADARDGGYSRHGWYGYMDKLDIERLVSHVLAQPRA